MKIIDVHTHGIGGFDTRTTSPDDILSIAKIHANRGVSEICPTVYPAPIGTMRENILAIKKAMEIQDSGLRDPGTSSKILGIHIEGPFLNPVKCGALDPVSFLMPERKSLEALIDGFEDIIRIMTIAPEMDGALSLIKNMADKGVIASMGHSDATYAEAKAGFLAGARCVTHIFNAMRGIHHREPGIAGFGLLNQEIYVEVIADPFHLDKKMIDFIFSVKNPERIIIISDSVKDLPESPEYHGIRSEDNRLLGGCLTIKDAAEHLIEKGLDRAIVSKAIADNPQEYLRQGKR